VKRIIQRLSLNRYSLKALPNW